MADVVKPGDKVHIMTRRLFEEDIRRHFVGEVKAASDGLAQILGYTFIFHSGTNEYKRLPGERTRLFSLGDSGHTVNMIPGDVVISSIVYRTVDDRLVITDGGSYSLPINEFGATR